MEPHTPNPPITEKPAGRMISPYESSHFFLMAVLANLAVQLLGGILLSELLQMFDLSGLDAMINLVFMLVLQAAYLGIYLASVPGKNRFLRWPVRNKMLITKRSPRALVIMLGLAAALGVLSLAAFFLPTVWFDTLLSLTGYVGQGVEFPAISDKIIGAIVVVLIAPAVEETIFRGAILSGLSRSHGVVKAVIMTAFVFMLSHMNPSQTLYQFLLGLVCGFTVAYTRSLLPGIVVHSVSNLCALLLDFTPLGGLLDAFLTMISAQPVVAVAVTAGCVAVFGAAIVLILWYLKKTAPEEAELPPVKEVFYRVRLAPLDPFAPVTDPRDPFAEPDPFAPAAVPQPALEPDEKLTEMYHRTKKTAAYFSFFTGCIVCGLIWIFVFVSGMGVFNGI